MKVTSEHHAIAKQAFQNKKSTPAVQNLLKEEHGLTHSQANDCCRTARKQLKIYKPKFKADKERAKKEADQQANKKTKVKED